MNGGYKKKQRIALALDNFTKHLDAAKVTTCATFTAEANAYKHAMKNARETMQALVKQCEELQQKRAVVNADLRNEEILHQRTKEKLKASEDAHAVTRKELAEALRESRDAEALLETILTRLSKSVKVSDETLGKIPDL